MVFRIKFGTQFHENQVCRFLFCCNAPFGQLQEACPSYSVAGILLLENPVSFSK
jgi:hypothetical protein